MPRSEERPQPNDERVFVGLILIFLRVGEELGFKREELVRRAQLDAQLLVDPDAYTELARFRALGEILLERHSPVTLGITAASTVDIGVVGLFGYVLRHCATLEAALAQVIRFANIVADPEDWWHKPDVGGGRSQIGILLRPTEEALGFPAVAQLASWIAFSRFATGTHVQPEQVSFRADFSDEREVLEAFFGCPVTLGAEHNQLVLPPGSLDLPIRGARPELSPSLQNMLQTISATAVDDASVHGQLRALLIERLPRGMSTRDQAARALAMSPRTLSRRLQAEGHSFREIIDEVRHELALSWLADASNSVTEVAFLLGYSEPSTFFRCFRRWTGHTPQAWRQQRSQTL